MAEGADVCFWRALGNWRQFIRGGKGTVLLAGYRGVLRRAETLRERAMQRDFMSIVFYVSISSKLVDDGSDLLFDRKPHHLENPYNVETHELSYLYTFQF